MEEKQFNQVLTKWKITPGYGVTLGHMSNYLRIKSSFETVECEECGCTGFEKSEKVTKATL